MDSAIAPDRHSERVDSSSVDAGRAARPWRAAPARAEGYDTPAQQREGLTTVRQISAWAWFRVGSSTLSNSASSGSAAGWGEMCGRLAFSLLLVWKAALTLSFETSLHLSQKGKIDYSNFLHRISFKRHMFTTARNCQNADLNEEDKARGKQLADAWIRQDKALECSKLLQVILSFGVGVSS